MRLWHYKLIPYLPKKQLISMRYEIGDLIKQYPNIKNGLVKYANDYDCIYLLYYFYIVKEELEKRKVNMNNTYNTNIIDIAFSKSNGMFFDESTPKLYKEHNDRYLMQCLYNLEEKATRNIISQEEWLRIYNKFKDFTDLWKGE